MCQHKYVSSSSKICKRSWCKESLNLCLESIWILWGILFQILAPNIENECFKWFVLEYLMLKLPIHILCCLMQAEYFTYNIILLHEWSATLAETERWRAILIITLSICSCCSTYSWSSRKRLPWKFEKVVITRAGRFEWALVSDSMVKQ